MAPCKLLCQVPTWNLEFWATGFCPSKELPGHIESSWSWKFCDSRVCLEATRLVESARRQKRMWCFDVLKIFEEISWRSFSYLAISMVCSVFSDVLEAQGKPVCLQILDVGSRIRWHVFWIRSHVFSMSQPQQPWKLMAIPPNNWCSRWIVDCWGCGTRPQQKQNRLFCRLFFS